MIDFDDLARLVRDRFVTVVMTGGLIAAPLPPAIMFGVSLFKGLEGEIGFWPSLLSGLALGVALEAVGIGSNHTALRAYSDHKKQDDPAALGKLKISAFVSVVYIIIGVSGIWLFSESAQIGIPGTIAYLIAPLIYISAALLDDESHTYQTAIEKARVRKEIRVIQAQARAAIAEISPPERPANVQRTSSERPAGKGLNIEKYAPLLNVVESRARGFEFSPGDVQKWTGKGRTLSFDLIKLGIQTGLFIKVSKGKYKLNKE